MIDKEKILNEVATTLNLSIEPVPDDAFTTYDFIDYYKEKTGRKIGHSWASRKLREAFREGELERIRRDGTFYYRYPDVPAEETG